MAKALDVYLAGLKAGQLVQKDDGRLSFAYDSGYVKNPGARPLSLSLPLGAAAQGHNACHAVFGGMLPDGDVRIRLAKALGVSARNDFSLLAEIGGECAGAVSLWPPAGPRSSSGTAQRKELDATRLESLLKKLPIHPLLSGEGVRLSLAGAQNKLALVSDGGKFFLPAKDEPSTHILKIAPEGFDGVLENELLCLRLAASAGIPAASASLGRAGSVAYICVERFDRTRRDGLTLRLHQEDFCQALGIAPECKYQNEGGPSLAAAVRLLRGHCVRPAADVSAFLALAYFNYLIGNADAHGKNFSLLLGENGPSLAPAYDLISTAAFPALNRSMAMKVGSEYDPDRIGARQWEKLAKECDLKPAFVQNGLRNMAARVRGHAVSLAKALAREHGENKAFGAVQDVVAKRVEKALA